MKPLFRSSELDRVFSCNGSIVLVPLVAPRDGTEGHEGTLLHYQIAERLIRDHGAVPPDGGLPPPDVPPNYKLPSNSAWIVDWAIRHVMEVIAPTWSLMVEVEMEHEFERWINRGHADVIGISPDGTESHGIDWKTGRDPVDPADNNDQVGSYIALQKCEWPALAKSTFQIAQPRVSEADGMQRISTVVVENLDGLISSMDSRAVAALDNSMELNSGRKQCAYCPVGCQCYALQEDQNLMKVKMTPEMIARIKREPDDATLGEWVITSRMLERPTKDAVELLHKRIETAGYVDAKSGVRITRQVQKGSYTVTDEPAFFAEARALLQADERMARAFKPSMTRITDEIAAAMNIPKTGIAPVTAEGIFDAKLRPLVEQGERRILVFT